MVRTLPRTACKLPKSRAAARLLAPITVAVLIMHGFLLVACSPGSNEPQKPASKTVVIATLLSHPSLDEIGASIKTRMKELGWQEGVNISYVDKNANGSPQVAATIAADIEGMKADAVVPITTPMSQAVAKVVSSPIVFAAVTDPVGAGLLPSLKETKEGMTGVSDAWPYERQLALLRELVPKAKTIGVLFNPADAASDYGIRQIRDISKKMGLALVEVACASPAEVGTAAASVIRRVDALYLSSDATVISGFPGAAQVAFRAKKALIVGDRGTVEKGGLATVSVGYSSLGRQVADLLNRVLRGERRLEVVVAQGDELFVNLEAAKRSAIVVPAAVLTRAKEVFRTIQ